MYGSICDPVLLRKCSWTVYYELFGFVVVSGSSLHFDSIVAVSKLGQTKASSYLQPV